MIWYNFFEINILNILHEDRELVNKQKAESIIWFWPLPSNTPVISLYANKVRYS
jgi:hypothetical protein